MVDSPTTEKVCIDMPVNLAKVLRAEAMLQDITFEQNVLCRLHDMVCSWLASDWPQEMFEQAYTGQSYEERLEKEKQEVAVQ